MFAEAQRVDRGEYNSLFRLLRVVIGFQPARIELVLDGRVVRTRALMLAVANTPDTGLGLTLAPQARLDDGAFDVSVYSGFSRWELVRHLGAIIGGRPRYSPKIRSYRGVRVGSSRPLPVRIDAEDLGTTPAAFSVRPGALQVIAPAQAGPAGTDAG